MAPAVIKIVPYSLTAKHQLTPLYRTPLRIVAAIADPLATDAWKALALCAQTPVTPVLTSAENLEAIVQRLHGEVAFAIFGPQRKRRLPMRWRRRIPFWSSATLEL